MEKLSLEVKMVPGPQGTYMVAADYGGEPWRWDRPDRLETSARSCLYPIIGDYGTRREELYFYQGFFCTALGGKKPAPIRWYYQVLRPWFWDGNAWVLPTGMIPMPVVPNLAETVALLVQYHNMTAIRDELDKHVGMPNEGAPEGS